MRELGCFSMMSPPCAACIIALTPGLGKRDHRGNVLDFVLPFCYTADQIYSAKQEVENMDSATVQMAKRGVITIPQTLREAYGMQPGDTFTLLDLGGVFVLSPRRSEVDFLAERIGAQWAEKGETLETMLQALREERDRRGC
jgi:bifunctional DNA-binding transcriptional regulator/antitoxin component of YhaV-PrlF toxin-antitoxin module